MTTNQKVITSIGPGYIQGRLEDGKIIVRLPVNEITKSLPSITPYAKYSGLWVFSEKEIK